MRTSLVEKLPASFEKLTLLLRPEFFVFARVAFYLKICRCAVDLALGFSIATIAHNTKLDWIELNETGKSTRRRFFTVFYAPYGCILINFDFSPKLIVRFISRCTYCKDQLMLYCH